jgi:hypothetical protein
VIADPRVQQALADRRVRQMFQVTRARLGLGPNPVTANANSRLASALIGGHVGPGAPITTSVTPPTVALPPNGIGMALAPQSQPATVTVDLPTPEELAMTKRLLSQVVTGRFQGSGIEPADAAQLAPKIDQLRSALHDASPEWKAADNYYAQAKGFKMARRRIGAGFGAPLFDIGDEFSFKTVSSPFLLFENAHPLRLVGPAKNPLTSRDEACRPFRRLRR